MLQHPIFPYAFPYALFMAISIIAAQLPNGDIWGYPLKTILVAGSLIYLWKKLEKFGGPHWVLAILTGVAVIIPWIALEGYYPLLSEDTLFDPEAEIPAQWQFSWLVVRVFGMVVVVAIMEEILWRGFLYRWLINEDFRSVPYGVWSQQAFWITSIFFAIQHMRWLPGLITGMLFNALYLKTRSLMACIIAHATANLLLATYVLKTKEWLFF